MQRGVHLTWCGSVAARWHHQRRRHKHRLQMALGQLPERPGLLPGGGGVLTVPVDHQHLPGTGDGGRGTGAGEGAERDYRAGAGWWDDTLGGACIS